MLVLPNGRLLGAVRERFGAGEVTLPIIGVKDPVTTVAALAADCSPVQSSCVSTVCTVSRGTFRIDAAGAWNSCRDSNLAAGACTGAAMAFNSAGRTCSSST